MKFCEICEIKPTKKWSFPCRDEYGMLAELEIVCKEGDPTKICRKEIVIPVSTKNELDHYEQICILQGMEPDPPWVKHKHEFEYQLGGFTYNICIQDIKNFAYLLEVEYISEKDDSLIHEPNLRKIITDLGCDPIDPKDFSERIKRYISENSTP